jgi:hypothetical protein
MKFSYTHHLTNLSRFFLFFSFDRLLLSTSVDSNESNIQKIFFFFHCLLCHVTREAVGPTIERKREKKKKENNNKHIHAHTSTNNTLVHSFYRLFRHLPIVKISF